MALLNRRTLAAVQQASCKGQPDTRYGLDGVQLDGQTIVATDGHLLFYAESPAEMPASDWPDVLAGVRESVAEPAADASVFLPNQLVTDVCKVGAKAKINIGEHIAVVQANGSPGRIVASNVSTEASLDRDIYKSDSERVFPKWDRVIPKAAAIVSVTIGADLLIRIGKAAKLAAGKGSTAAVNFAISQPADPKGTVLEAVKLKLTGSPTVLGVVMPMRP